MFKVGILSDTHGLIRQEAVEALIGVQHIIHAGDVGKAEILRRLSEIAPVTAISGNIDVGRECSYLPPSDAVELAGQLFYVIHDLKSLDINPSAGGVRVVISGHSHKAMISHHSGVLYINPGSAGPRRFRRPVTIANITIEGSALDARVTDLHVV